MVVLGMVVLGMVALGLVVLGLVQVPIGVIIVEMSNCKREIYKVWAK